MKKTISTILVIAGVIGFLLLSGGGIRMSTLASQSGDSVVEYYYQSMGTCMIGFSFVAAGLLWGLSWMVAAWPDNQRITPAVAQNHLGAPSNLTFVRSVDPIVPASWAEAQPLFYKGLASVDPAAPVVFRRLLSQISNSVDATVWGTGPHDVSVTLYVQHMATSSHVCTMWSNGLIDLHLESLNDGIVADATSLKRLRQLVQALFGNAFSEEAPFEPVSVPFSTTSSAQGFSNLVAVLRELIHCLKNA